MEWNYFITVFFTVLLAELGDKTQLATMGFASNPTVDPWLIFAGASLALIVASGLGILGGQWLSGVISEKVLKLGAGLAFIAVGCWTLVKG